VGVWVSRPPEHTMRPTNRTQIAGTAPRQREITAKWLREPSIRCASTHCPVLGFGLVPGGVRLRDGSLGISTARAHHTTYDPHSDRRYRATTTRNYGQTAPSIINAHRGIRSSRVLRRVLGSRSSHFGSLGISTAHAHHRSADQHSDRRSRATTPRNYGQTVAPRALDH
jgi:hypothetical protein